MSAGVVFEKSGGRGEENGDSKKSCRRQAREKEVKRAVNRSVQPEEPEFTG